MIEIFDIGIKILLGGTSVFFLVFFILCSGWAKPKHPERHFIIGFLMGMFYTFWFLLGGVLILVLINLFSKYLFPFLKLWKFPL